MEPLIKANSEERSVELDREQRIEAGEEHPQLQWIEVGERELRNFSVGLVSLVIASNIALVFIVMIVLKGSQKSMIFFIYFVVASAVFVDSILVVVVIVFEMAYRVRGNIVPEDLEALQTSKNFSRKRIMLVSMMFSCSALAGYFIVSFLVQ